MPTIDPAPTPAFLLKRMNKGMLPVHKPREHPFRTVLLLVAVRPSNRPEQSL